MIPSGERAPLHTACYVNAAASIAYDFDDYLFAGHTGHSAVIASLAFAEATGATGRELVTAQVAANEVAGRLGAAFLLGPHNGQMWTYIHALAGAAIAGRFLGPDETAIRNAIGIALAQPPFPLAPGFFGPDSKMLLASEPLVAGIRAAELAAEGLTGARDPIGDPDGMLAKMATRPLPFVFEGLGDVWLSETLAFKLYPGCAYIDTPLDAFEIAAEHFAQAQGRPLEAADVAAIHVEATILTAAMELMGAQQRAHRATPTHTDVNFSVGLSLGVLLVTGELSVHSLSPRILDMHNEKIQRIAARVTVEPTDEMNAGLGGLPDLGIDPIKLFDPDYAPSLADAETSRYRMSFPARVTIRTTTGEHYEARVDVPRGAPGRPFDEIARAVRGKFVRAARGVVADEQEAADALAQIDACNDVRALIAMCCDATQS